MIVVVIEFSKFFQNMEAVGILSTLIYGCFKVNNCESWYSYYAALSFWTFERVFALIAMNGVAMYLKHSEDDLGISGMS